MRVIALRGQKQSGKDYVGCTLKDYIRSIGEDYVSHAFAEPFKKALAIMFHLPEQKLFGSDGDKATPIGIKWEQLPVWVQRKHGNPNPEADILIRGLLTTFGNEVMKTFFGDDFWVQWMAKEIELSKANLFKNFIITDCRFDVEAKAIIDNGGQVWLITGRKQNDEAHSSESETRATTFYTHTIDNSIPGPDHVRSQIIKILGLPPKG